MSVRSMGLYLLVAVGGAVGSMCRYHASVLFGAKPLTTFAVNIVGSFLIGMLAAFPFDPRLRLFLGTGILGGFTTFSAWQLEAVSASRGRGGELEMIAILLGSLALGFLACWGGLAVGHRLR